MKKKKYVLLAGARPNYMKIFPLWREIQRTYTDIEPLIIHTGQHYDDSMSGVFFKDFGMSPPDYYLAVGSGTHGWQTGRVMIEIEPVLEKIRPDLLVVVGDVNSTVAGTLVGVKMGIPVAHIEAGLRSGDRSMPEEINRIVTDSVSDMLFTSCRDADSNLVREGVAPEKIHFVGNIMIDSLMQLLPYAEKSIILEERKLKRGQYIVVTLHRPSNVDDPDVLRKIMSELAGVSRKYPVIFPVHPRTRRIMEENEIVHEGDQFQIVDPLGYQDFLSLVTGAKAVITDSGGIQEETSYLGIPCLTLRPNTERPITITQGTNRLVKIDDEPLLDCVESAVKRLAAFRCAIEKWDGKTADRIVQILRRY